MAKKIICKDKPVSALVNFVVWLTGVLVSLSVGFGMAYKTLTIPIPVISSIVPWAGWIVIVLTVLSVILAVADRM